MKTSERRAALRQLRVARDTSIASSWNTVRDWIRGMVRIEPKVMRQVVKMEFGDLGNWIEKGKGNIKACGCLVGTTALALIADRNHFRAVVNAGEFKHTTDDFREDTGAGYYNHEKGDYVGATKVIAFLAKKQLVEDMKEWSADAGSAAGHLGFELGQDIAVALIKDEIVRALKRRQAAKRRKLVAVK